MCFFARTDYRCGDFKWGNMKHRCPREHRIGEHCGAKLVDAENQRYEDDDCKFCQDIETKKRRLRKEQDNIRRWQSDSRNSFRASIEKATRESQNLVDQINELTQRRPSVKLSRGNAAEPGESETQI